MARRSIKRTTQALFPEHPIEEHRLRLDRARRVMREMELDVLISGRNVNVFYFTGSRFVFVGHDSPVAIAPQSTAIVTKDADIYCQRFGAFDNDDVGIHTTASESLEYYDNEMEIVDILKDYGVRKGARIGAEWGEGLCVGVNPIKFMALKRRLEDELGAEVVDANPILWRVMAVKSRLEIERMKVAVNAACRAMERVYDRIEVGMNELQVAGMARRFMLEEGADAINHAQVMAEGDNGMKLMSCDAVDRPIQKGWVHLDLGARYKRYASDINRGIFLGRKPTVDEKALYDCRLAVSELMDKMIRPGVCIDDTVLAVKALVEDSGYVLQEIGGGPFVGHGIGLEPYQRPNLALSCAQPEVQNNEGKVLFEKGMMFTYEMSIDKPGLRLPFFNIEDNLVVTETGIENMSGSLSRELCTKA